MDWKTVLAGEGMKASVRANMAVSSRKHRPEESSPPSTPSFTALSLGASLDGLDSYQESIDVGIFKACTSYNNLFFLWV